MFGAARLWKALFFSYFAHFWQPSFAYPGPVEKTAVVFPAGSGGYPYKYTPCQLSLYLYIYASHICFVHCMNHRYCDCQLFRPLIVDTCVHLLRFLHFYVCAAAEAASAAAAQSLLCGNIGFINIFNRLFPLRMCTVILRSNIIREGQDV